VSRNEFIFGYCERSGMSVEQYQQHYVALPCLCGDDPDTPHWATVGLRGFELCSHLSLYSPSREQLLEMMSEEFAAGRAARPSDLGSGKQ
jgi:hypothetical protein